MKAYKLPTYKIIRTSPNPTFKKRTIKRHLTLNEAMLHCQSKEAKRVDANGDIIWMDDFTRE